MTAADVDTVTALLAEHQATFAYHAKFTREEVLHWIVPTDKVVFAYVVESEGAITDFISFYSLPSSVSGHSRYSMVKAAYMFYWVPKGLGQDRDRNISLVHDALVMAQKVRPFPTPLTTSMNSTCLIALRWGTMALSSSP